MNCISILSLNMIASATEKKVCTVNNDNQTISQSKESFSSFYSDSIARSRDVLASCTTRACYEQNVDDLEDIKKTDDLKDEYCMNENELDDNLTGSKNSDKDNKDNDSQYSSDSGTDLKNSLDDLICSDELLDTLNQNSDELNVDVLDNMPIVLESTKLTPVSSKVSVLIDNMIDSLTRSKISNALNERNNISSKIGSLSYLNSELTKQLNNVSSADSNNNNYKIVYQIYFIYLVTLKELSTLKQTKERFNYKEQKKKAENRIKRRQLADKEAFLDFQKGFMQFD
ncbi:hypothetical protein [Succinivibrio faecicola]|uniref:Uncharacterized protein n=1 Tax=Succinivibrio faecicola TaxID=2820300 RepID=A0ABS7DGC4_9GAMM|nr:hypothetical protein [Succinivibrio faecicola]MBW7570356.1 hypothetical protein [Succinivibrio faecicola]